MSAKKRAQAYSHQKLGTDSRTMAFYFGISLLFHLICIGAMVIAPDTGSSRRLAPGAINVSLVSLPGPPAAGPAPKPAAKPLAPVKKEVKPVPKVPVIETPPPKPVPEVKKPEKTVSLKPTKKKKKIKEKKSLKKKTKDRQKMIDQALTKVEKKVEKSESDSVQQALDRLKKKVAETEAARSSQTPTVRSATGATGSGAAGVTGTGSGGGAGGRRILELIDIYKIEVAFQVERNWAFSQQLIGSGRNLQASLVFKVLPSGEITEIRFTERSGHAYLDESAHKAVVKANPVSPHPAALRRPYVTVALRFTPEGIRK